jgi:hypothetical protein
MVQAGLDDLDERARSAHGRPFTDLAFDEQTGVLRQVEGTPFFGLVHFLTLLGCFSLPAYGGNREEQGWAQIGFESRHHWLPPFGHYDAEYIAQRAPPSDSTQDVSLDQPIEGRDRAGA